MTICVTYTYAAACLMHLILRTLYTQLMIMANANMQNQMRSYSLYRSICLAMVSLRLNYSRLVHRIKLV